MDDDEFERICTLAEYPRDGEQPPLSVTEEIFTVIKRQVEHRRLRAALRQHRQDKTLKRYMARHGNLATAATASTSVSDSVDKNSKRGQHESIYAIAGSVSFSPCMLARVLLEAKYGWSTTTISNLFKDVLAGARRWPLRLPDQEVTVDGRMQRSELLESEYNELWRQVEECISNDPYCSPLADRIRHNMGLEYEYILCMKLRSRGLVFENEDMLREKGLSKTPDVRLLLPMGVRDSDGELHVVNWIDSKAMFGDRHTHETENASQLQGYVNRYGPGMVIYWFGHVAQLSTDRDVFITNAFPLEIVLPGDFDPLELQPPCVPRGGLAMTKALVVTAFDKPEYPVSTCAL